MTRLAAIAPFLALPTPALFPRSGQQRTPLEITYPVETRWEARFSPGRRRPGAPRPAVVEAPTVTVHLGVGTQEDPPGHHNRPILARLRTSGRGEFATTVEVPVRWKNDPAAVLWARTASPGMAERAYSYPLHSWNKGQLEIAAIPAELPILYIHPGATFLGSVQTSSGEPLPNAQLWACTGEELPATTKPWPAESTDAAGRFALHTYADGPHGLHVRKPNQGSVHLNRLGVGARDELLAADRAPLQLTLQGGVRLRGRLSTPDGAALAGRKVVARPTGFKGAPSREDCLFHERSGGLFGDVVGTDEHGNFEFSALVEGEYSFFVIWAQKHNWKAEHPSTSGLDELVAERVAVSAQAPMDPLELVSRKRFLLVTVHDQGGEIVELKEREERLEVRLARPDQGLLGIHEKEDGVPEWRFPLYAFGVGNTRRFELEGNRDYLVVWKGVDTPYQETTVRVGPRDYWITRRLQLAAQAQPPSLELQVVDPRGVPFDGVRIRALSPTSGYEVTSPDGWGGIGWSNGIPGVRRVDLPPGTFDIEIDSNPRGGCLVSQPLERTPYCLARRLVTLTSGRDSVLKIRLGAAGHLDFRSSKGATGLSDSERAAFYPRASTRGLSYIDSYHARRTLGGAEVLWIPEQGDPIRHLVFEVPGAPSYEFAWILPGWPARCLSALSVGRGTLRVRRGAEVLFERVLEIREGEVATVDW